MLGSRNLDLRPGLLPTDRLTRISSLDFSEEILRKTEVPGHLDRGEHDAIGPPESGHLVVRESEIMSGHLAFSTGQDDLELGDVSRHRRGEFRVQASVFVRRKSSKHGKPVERSKYRG